MKTLVGDWENVAAVAAIERGTDPGDLGQVRGRFELVERVSAALVAAYLEGVSEPRGWDELLRYNSDLQAANREVAQAHAAAKAARDDAAHWSRQFERSCVQKEELRRGISETAQLLSEEHERVRAYEDALATALTLIAAHVPRDAFASSGVSSMLAHVRKLFIKDKDGAR